MLWAKVRGQAAQRREDEAFDEEIREHIALLEQRYTAQGMSAREAARAARRQFGNVTVLKERQRAQRGILSPAEWWRDVRFGMRMLAKRPASNAAVVLALALGIGMNTAVFTFVNGLLLRPPQGVSETRKMIELWLKQPKQTGPQGYLPFNYPDYAYYRDHARRSKGCWPSTAMARTRSGITPAPGQILHAQVVSGNFFSLLGVNAALGRTLSADDDRIDNPRQVVVLSYACWKNKMGGDPGVLGRTLMLNGEAFTVVGVAPARFTGLMVATEPDFWAPLDRAGEVHARQDAADEPRLLLADCGGKDAQRGRQEKRAGRDARAGEAVGAGASGRRRGSGCRSVCDDADAGAVPRIRVCVYGAADDRVCAGAADCVHQCGEPAAGAGNGTGAGDGDAGGTGRGARRGWCGRCWWRA